MLKDKKHIQIMKHIHVLYTSLFLPAYNKKNAFWMYIVNKWGTLCDILLLVNIQNDVYKYQVLLPFI